MQRQVSDSIKVQYIEQLALKNPLVRQFNMSSELIPERKISSKLYGDDFIEADALIYRNQMFFRMPVIDWDKSSFSTSIGLLNQLIQLQNVKNYNDALNVQDMEFTTTTLSLSMSFNTRAKLFNKPVIYNTSVTSVFNPSFTEYELSFTGVALLSLKRTATTSLGVGAALLINPSTEIPAFLLLNYSHVFSRCNLELIANLPYHLALRKEIDNKNFLSVVNQMSGSVAFFNIDNRFMPEKSRYGTSEIKSGVLYERRLGKRFVLGLSVGALYTVTSKMEESNSYWDNSYFIKNQNTIDVYFDASISLLPFLKGVKR